MLKRHPCPWDTSDFPAPPQVLGNYTRTRDMLAPSRLEDQHRVLNSCKQGTLVPLELPYLWEPQAPTGTHPPSWTFDQGLPR